MTKCKYEEESSTVLIQVIPFQVIFSHCSCGHGAQKPTSFSGRRPCSKGCKSFVELNEHLPAAKKEKSVDYPKEKATASLCLELSNLGIQRRPAHSIHQRCQGAIVHRFLLRLYSVDNEKSLS